MKSRLVVFSRFPEAGTTKTRLIPALGAEGAANLQREMTEYVVRQARALDVEIEIRCAGGDPARWAAWLGEDLTYVDQDEGDLGERMARVFENREEPTLIVGADCPANAAANLRAAFAALRANDVVIGPAEDGGYYLIGLNQPRPELFVGIEWGGDEVYERTINAAKDLSVHALPMLSDVDLPADVPPRISVIIPARNDAEELPETIARCEAGFRVEVLVADEPNLDRAARQNAAAAKARGELLLFLHADTALPDGWDWIVRETLRDPNVALGAFAFRIREDFRGKTWVERGTNLRSKKRGMPYGDQGLFLRRETFESLGGFPDQPIMEDYALVRAARSAGKVVTTAAAVTTSGRRWLRHGALKTTCINQMMIAGYHAGVSPERLASFYRKR